MYFLLSSNKSVNKQHQVQLDILSNTVELHQQNGNAHFCAHLVTYPTDLFQVQKISVRYHMLHGGTCPLKWLDFIHAPILVSQLIYLASPTVLPL